MRCQSQYSMNLIVTRVTLKRGVIIQISIFIFSKFEFNQMLLTHRDRILEQVHQTFFFVFQFASVFFYFISNRFSFSRFVEIDAY